MKIEQFFEDVNLAKIVLNGEIHELSEIDLVKNKKYTYNKDLFYSLDISLIYNQERLCSIDGYILDMDKIHSEISTIGMEDIYWTLDDIWDDMASFVVEIIENKYPKECTYFLIKNINIPLEYKDDLGDIFIIENLKYILSKYNNIDLDYISLIYDYEKGEINSSELNMGLIQNIKYFLIRTGKTLINKGRNIKKEFIYGSAKKYGFFEIEIENEKKNIWLKEV